MKCEYRRTKTILVLIGIVLLGIAIMSLIVNPVNAIGDIYITEVSKSDSCLFYNFTGSLTRNIAFDGKNILDYNLNVSSYSVCGLTPNSSHTMFIFNATNIYNITYSKTSALNITPAAQTNQEKFFGLILPWVLFIIAIICCVAGLYGAPFVSLVGSAICLFELVNTTTNGSFIMDVLYICVVIAGVILSRGEGL